MSSTNRAATRSAHDFYPTPAWCVDRLLEAIRLPGGVWLEPAAGRGAIVGAVNARRADVHWKLVEAHPEPGDAAVYASLGAHPADVLTRSFFDVRPDDLAVPVDVIITNPPFSAAMEFVEHAMTFRPRAVVMLLRLNFLASEGRAQFMRTYAPDVYVLPNRPSFTGGLKTDSIEYAWLVWPGARRRRTGRVGVLALTERVGRRGEP